MNKPLYGKRMTTTLVVSLPEEDHRSLFQIAENETKTVSDIVRDLIKSYINKKEAIAA